VQPTASQGPEDRDERLNGVDVEPWYSGAEGDTPLPGEQNPESSVRDPTTHHKAVNLLQFATQSTSSENILRSRVLGDIWHLMHQFPIPQAHGLRRPFARALRNAFFKYDPEDREILERFFGLKKVTWDQMLRTHPTWVLKRIRRFVPPPEELLPRLAKVLYDFGPLLCAKSRQPVLNDKGWEVSRNVLENVRRAYYSDPPGIQLYYSTGKDKYGLSIYRCCRGTNAIEGGVHQNVIRWFGAFNAAPDFAVQLLRDYTLYHNLKVCLQYLNWQYLILTYRLGHQIVRENHTLVHTTSGLEIRSPLSSTHCQLGWKPCLLNLALEGGSMETGTSSQMNSLEFFP